MFKGPDFNFCWFHTSAHSEPGTPQSGPGTPHSDGEASGRENQSDDEKWDGGAKSDQSEDEEEKRHYSDEERENSDDDGPINRKSGTLRLKILCRNCIMSRPPVLIFNT